MQKDLKYVRATGSLLAPLIIGFGALIAKSTAATVFSTGPTVTTITHSAVFSSLTVSDTDLTNYSENGVLVTVPDVSFTDFTAFAPGDFRTTGFHYGRGGNTEFVSIRLVDGSAFTAVDFLLGDGSFNTVVTNLNWQAYNNGVLTGSGVHTAIPKGSVVGWTDTAGFDELRVAALSNDISPGFGNFQAIALDDVRIGGAALSVVPEPSGILALGCLLMGGLSLRSRRACV